MLPKKKPGRPKKGKAVVEKVRKEYRETGGVPADDLVTKHAVVNEAPSVQSKASVVEEPEDEVLSDDEANAMIDRVEEKKKAEARKIELSVDAQDWTRQDPVIPEGMESRVWVAVYRCSEGHKTKATNRQASSGIACFQCKEVGKKQKAEIVTLFLNRPSPAERNKKS